MGCDFVRVDINEHLGNEAEVYGGTFKGHEGDPYKFDCPRLDPERDAHYFVYGFGMHSMQYFRLNGKDGWWIEPSVSPNSVKSQLRPGIIWKGNLKEKGNTLQVYSNPIALQDDFRIYYILIVYPTKV